MEYPINVLLVILAVTLAVMFYSVFLQKAATRRQAKSMQVVQESVERQKEAIQLQRESNDLLREILTTLKGRRDA
jgi:hypothetical protein